MTPDRLRAFYERNDEAIDADPDVRTAHEGLLAALEAGTVRAAEPDDTGTWKSNAWVKRAILSGFRRGETVEMEGPGFPYLDKATFPARRLELADGVRLVPGGSSLRRGVYVGRGVVIMPPAYINVGAWVDDATMVDSHALVGSCAQLGSRVHLSAGAQIGGVLEPPGALPVIVEDDAFVGALCGVFEGVHVEGRAVLAAGVILTASTMMYDLPNAREIRGRVPAGAVVVPGSRPARDDYGSGLGLQVAAPVIVKYRDERTDAATALEDALR